MSVIADKFGIPSQAFKNMVAAGVVSTSWAMKDDIVVYYKEREKVIGKTEAVKETAEHFNKDRTDIYCILRNDVFL